MLESCDMRSVSYTSTIASKAQAPHKNSRRRGDHGELGECWQKGCLKANRKPHETIGKLSTNRSYSSLQGHSKIRSIPLLIFIMYCSLLLFPSPCNVMKFCPRWHRMPLDFGMITIAVYCKCPRLLLNRSRHVCENHRWRRR